MKKGRITSYYPVLHIPEAQVGDWSIKHSVEPAGKKFWTGNIRTAMYGSGRAEELSWPHETTWHSLIEAEDGLWMSDLPIEQVQHDRELQGFSGTVLVGGLGLGYAVTALAVKSRVKRIVVVEKQIEVIQLVWDHLDLGNKKVEVICADLFDFLRETKETFRYAFYDIWTGDGETTFHTTVIPLRELSRDKVNIVRCWNEDVMRGQLLSGLLMRLELLEHPPMLAPNETRDSMLTKLADADSESVFVRWAAPFWQRVQLEPKKDWRHEAHAYVQLYGL